jgi:diacylglycerol kinase family enzyme
VRVAQGRAGQSPFIKVTRGKKFRVRLGRPLPCELDGSARTEVRKMRVKVHPGSITICVPSHR